MQKIRSLGTVSIIGPGLIGGSIGLGLKGHNLAKKVIGVGHRESSLEKALEMCAIDQATKDLKEGVREADVVILCTSVELIPSMAERVIPWMKNSAILTDVGSTKSYIVKKILGAIHELPLQCQKDVKFIGGHPLAGSEQRGIEAAQPDLFQGALCILTPVRGNGQANNSRESRRARDIIKGMWEALGAKVKFLSPEEHDLIMAFISHLPQLVAASLVNVLRPGQKNFTARGFKDTTRIASSEPTLWQEIHLQNREALLEAITDFQEEIDLIKKALLKKDSKQLFARLKRAKNIRDSLPDNKSYASKD
ncbi:MAG TPA: prephenate dehydrogenase [Candidatus Hypogeohydataceae bacterium YC41]